MAFEIIEATPATESSSSNKFKPKVAFVCVGGGRRGGMRMAGVGCLSIWIGRDGRMYGYVGF